MIKNYSLACAISLALFGCGGSSTDTPTTPGTPPTTPIAPILDAFTPLVQIIPAPFALAQEDGSWIIDKNTQITYMGQTLQDEAEYLAAKFKQNNNVSLSVKELKELGATPIVNTIELVVDPSVSESPEGYTLNIKDGKARIVGDTDAGVFYGVQSLLQLVALDKQNVPNVSITDAPTFEYRGMHLDVARNFVGVEDVKKFLDQLAYHKINKFHWHLTDDQGWRIEIEGWPKLTEVGGCKPGTPPYGDRGAKPIDPTPQCGFYTQAQIKEVVAYAEARHIEIIPEIDMPGHMTAAIASYPEFGVQDATDFKQNEAEWNPNAGGPGIGGPTVKYNWGMHPYLLNTEDATFDWINDVFTQVADLFPNSDYIHLGGDEAAKAQWEHSEKTQQKIKDLGITKTEGSPSLENQLQSWFIGKVEDIITSKGKTVVGWNEIMHGGNIAKETVIMSWTGQGPGEEAAKEGHPVIMASGLYFDHYQAPEVLELAKGVEYESIGQLTTVRDVYKYEPIPSSLAPEFHKNILGAQGNLWSEYMHTYDKVEYEAFPRVTALAEMLWTPTAKRDYDDFISRLPATLARLQRAGVNHANVFDAIGGNFNDGTTVTSTMKTEGSNNLWKIRDFDESTYYWTNGAPQVDDAITFKLEKPITDGYIDVLSGKPDLGDKLNAADIEVSENGTDWALAASIQGEKGAAKFTGSISYFRLRVTTPAGWLAIREIGYGEFTSVLESTVANDDELVTIAPKRAEFDGETVTYSIISGNEKLAYKIDPTSGVISVADEDAVTAIGALDEVTSIVHPLVIKLVVNGKLNIVEHQQAYIEIMNDVDGGAVAGLEKWKRLVDKDASKVYSSVDSVISRSARTIDLSAITADSATYELLVNAKDIDQNSALLLGSSVSGANTFVKQEQGGPEVYGLTFAGAGDTVFTAEAGKSVASIYGTDTQLTITVDGTTIKLYINGILSGQKAGKMLLNSATTKLGDSGGDPAGNAGDEIIKGFAAYNKVLTDAEILERAQASGFAAK